MARTKKNEVAEQAQVELEAPVAEMGVAEVFNLGGNATTTSTGRGINGAIELNNYAQSEARRLIDAAMDKVKEEAAEGLTTTKDMIDEALDSGTYASACNLIETVIGAPQCGALTECTDDELSRLLESRRSDRSKTKKKGLRTNVAVMLTYFAAIIAEMAIRAASGKEYVAQSAATIDVEALALDQEALNKKIRSLQSKQSNLRRALKYIPADTDAPERDELKRVQAQIEELQSRRTSTVKTVSTKVPSAEVLKKAIAAMSEEEKKALMEQLQAVNG